MTIIKTYSKKELCNMYGVDARKLKLWLKPILKRPAFKGYQKFQRLFSPLQVKEIFSHLGEPNSIVDET